MLVDGCDQDGALIAKDGDGTVWKFVFTFCEQDFDMDVMNGLPNSKRAQLFCKHCRATNSSIWGKNPHPQLDLRPAASWRQQLVTSSAEFKRRLVRPHPLTDSKYFNKYTSRNDLMHCMYHNGVYGIIIASVIWYLIHIDGVPSLGTTQPRRLDKINEKLEAFYKEHPGISSRLDKLQKK